MNKNILILFGPSGSGKTTKAMELAQKICQKGYLVGGIVAPGIFFENKRFSFDIVDLMNQQRCFLARRDMASSINIGPFGFSHEGFSFGDSAIQKAISHKADLIIIDEIGPLELQNQGWAKSLRLACQSEVATILITSRPGTMEAIREIFFPDYSIISYSVEDASQCLSFFP